METVESGNDFRIVVRRYGPTVHLTPSGELDLTAEAAFTGVLTSLAGDVAVIACDLRHVPFVDVVGMHCVLDFQQRAHARGARVVFYDWQPQPRRLLGLLGDFHLVDGADWLDLLQQGEDLIRALPQRTEAARARGASSARRRTPRAAGGRGSGTASGVPPSPLPRAR
ncbi:STAS domain-containing protein [Streptomyces sp. ISL-36]|uniref:STAS domain-containing protein n=1 Tax=Streptomyces sp. ISL-36 TaxID=2819182 RepID=UPI001BE55275|nr:STAS domain-containing protein [Streptomyces sp. ISL-36]MBT2439575.1 STAS domain-containing protein [Streptomyces sp. ISL-36]